MQWLNRSNELGSAFSDVAALRESAPGPEQSTSAAQRFRLLLGGPETSRRGPQPGALDPKLR
jgi:hypothetical protein